MIRDILRDELTRVSSNLAALRVSNDGKGVPDVPDVVVLDSRAIPDAARTLHAIRRQWATAGVVIVNAQDDRAVIGWLDLGADDACDCTAAILVPRVHAIARRARILNAQSRVVIGDLILDRERRHVWCAGRRVELASREYDVLCCLFQQYPRVVARETLVDAVWHGQSAPSNTLEAHISFLRRKLVGSKCVTIDTVRGVGYVLAPHVLE